jgi:hypothetical protein
MAYTRSADGITKKGKTVGKVLASDGPNQAIQHGGKGGSGGKTNEEMLKLGRNMAKLANQKRG